VAALQGHLDMVCEKNEGTAHDFDKDPISFVRNGDWLNADGTTLGADNGIGVATGLAVMESNDIEHGPLEFVFTVEEETGLTGASEFGRGVLKSKYLLNLDGEEKGTLCIGCAGGVNTVGHRKITRRPASLGKAFRLKISGLKGGHSGVDIHQGRGNAIRVLGRVLNNLLEKMPVEIADLKGGSMRNAIPREAFAIVLVDDAKVAEFKSLLATYQSEMRGELGAFDPDVQITAEPVERPTQVLDAVDASAIVALLIALPHGVLAMSPDIAGLVQTSTNLATIAIRGDEVEIATSQRSSVESSKNGIAQAVTTIFRLAGFESEHSSNYSGWKPEPNGEIVKKLQAVHEEVFGKTAGLVAMHAGLECGVLGEKHPGMQMISFGPQIENPHSPNERVQISSVQEFWKLLTTLLERL
jgi:dipeptidase D